MAIVYDALLNYKIPEVRQRLRKRDTIFYALSVGLGQDPMDERQLDFIDHHKPLRALPSMAVVLGHPGFWIANPDTGADAVRVVHGEQQIRLHQPLPVEGEIVAQTRVTGLVDMGVGKGALMYTQKDVRDATSGALLATTSSTSFLRGDGGFGGPATKRPERHVGPMPETPPQITVDLPTRAEQALYYRLNGDDNPLHSDPVLAAKAGFPRPILHGLCTLGVVAHALLRALGDYDPARMREMELRFSAPVFPGETIRTEIWPDRARVVERDVVVVNKGWVVFA
jgi:acyl dehydratase